MGTSLSIASSFSRDPEPDSPLLLSSVDVSNGFDSSAADAPLPRATTLEFARLNAATRLRRRVPKRWLTIKATLVMTNEISCKKWANWKVLGWREGFRNVFFFLQKEKNRSNWGVCVCVCVSFHSAGCIFSGRWGHCKGEVGVPHSLILEWFMLPV